MSSKRVRGNHTKIRLRIHSWSLEFKLVILFFLSHHNLLGRFISGCCRELFGLKSLLTLSVEILRDSEQLTLILIIIESFVLVLLQSKLSSLRKSVVEPDPLHTWFHWALFGDWIRLIYYVGANLFDTLPSSLFYHWLQLTVLDRLSAQNQLLFVQTFCGDSFVNLWPRAFILIISVYYFDLRYFIDNI